MNPNSEATPMTRPTRVIGCDQPCSGPSWMPSTKPPMASADRTEPTTSKRPTACSRELATTLTLMISDTAARANGSANSHGQLTRSIRNDDTKSPRMPPAPAKPDQMPTARARSPRGKLEVITDNVTGMIIAAAAPATIRAIVSCVVEVASAAPTLATTKSASPVVRTGLRPQRSPIAPIGISSAASAMV